MTALLTSLGYLNRVTLREKQIEKFIREHPERYRRLPPVTPKTDVATVAEQLDRIQLDEVFGAYRRKKHTGSDQS